MIDRRCVVALWMLTFFPAVSLAQSDTPSDTAPAERERGPVVVELFTSQGCSSCPPADAVLRQIDEIAREKQLSVYALSFHVDYWNRLGWTDPYSDPYFSRRQGAYAAARDSRRVYTPQMIVNGQAEFNGSNRQKAREAINIALSSQAASQISIEPKLCEEDGLIEVQFDVPAAPDQSVLNLALVQSPPANDVTEGENEGRRLSHVNVVRAFRIVKLDEPTGRVSLRLPDDVDPSKLTVIAYLQNSKTLAIGAATSAAAG